MHISPSLAIFSVMVTLCLATSPLQAENPSKVTGMPWIEDLDEAHRISNQENKPMLLLFGSDRCLFCRKLEKYTLADPVVSETLRKQFVLVYLDYYKNPKAVEILEVKGLPCSVILSPNADLLGRVNGYLEKDKYQATLKSALEMKEKVVQSAAP